MKKTSKRPKTILVGVDYSKSSDNALGYAALLAKKGKADLMLFHSYEVPVVHTNSGIFFISYTAIKAANTKRLEKYKDKLKEEHPGLNIKIFTIGASFRIELEELQRKHAIQYIVMGLESKSRISKFIYGSHGTSIAGKMNCPVIIVPEKYKTHKIGKAVMAVDNLKTINYDVLKKVKDFSSQFHVLYSNVHIRTQQEFTFEKSTRSKKLPLEVVEANDFPDGISRYAKEHAKDLIIIVSKSHSAVYNFFNESNTKTIAFRSKIPVMAIHD
jgi:nucleotide-binding universal stress UspA family protein